MFAVQKAIRKFGENPSGDVPEVGFKYHTTIVRPYKLKGSLYLVDFPGSDGTENYAEAWKQFTSLPSSCILLLEFKVCSPQGGNIFFLEQLFLITSKISNELIICNVISSMNKLSIPSVHALPPTTFVTNVLALSFRVTLKRIR